MAIENLAKVIRSLTPEERESVSLFVEFLKKAAGRCGWPVLR
jgi:hypothetical protein